MSFLFVVFVVSLRIRTRVFTKMLYASPTKISLAHSHLIWNCMSFKSVYVGRVVANIKFCNLVRCLGLGQSWSTLISFFYDRKLKWSSDLGMCIHLYTYSFKIKAAEGKSHLPSTSLPSLRCIVICTDKLFNIISFLSLRSLFVLYLVVGCPSNHSYH